MDFEETYNRFPTEAACIAHLEQVRWDGTPNCPYCNSVRITSIPKEHRHHCNACNTTFSVTVNMIFHRTRLPLPKWFAAISIILNTTKQITARELAERLDINKNTAWFVIMRVQEAIVDSVQRKWLYTIADTPDQEG